MTPTTKKPLSLFLVLALVFFGQAAAYAQSAPANGDNPLFRHLPPDASDIYQINLPAINAKVSWEQLMAKVPAQKEDQKQEWLEFLKDPASAGIDIHQDMFITMANKDSQDSSGYTTFLVHLSDSAKFVSFLRTQVKGLRIFNYPGKGRGAGKDLTGAAWNKDLGIVTIVRPSIHELMVKGQRGVNTKTPPVSPAIAVLAAKKSFSALHGFDGSFYTTDPIFKAGFSDDADFHGWAAQGSGMAMLMKTFLKKDLTAGMGNFTKAMGNSGTRTLTTLRFEAGRIVFQSRVIMTPDAASLTAKFNGRPLNTDLLARIPKGDLLGMVNFHFDPAAIGAILDKAMFRSKLDSTLAPMELSTDKILHTFKGDFLVAAIGMARSADGGGKEPVPAIFFATTLDNTDQFRKLADKLKLLDDSVGMLKKMKAGYALQDNIFVVSKDNQLAGSFFTNTERRNTDFVTERLKDNPFSLYIDIKTLTSFIESIKGEAGEKNKKMLPFLQAFDKIIFTAGKVQGNEMESRIEVKMSDASENSLRTLFKLFP